MQNLRVAACGFCGCGTSKQSSPFWIGRLQRLRGVWRPQASLLGRPSDEPISDGVLPLGMLHLLDLPNQVLEDLGQQVDRLRELLKQPARSRLASPTPFEPALLTIMIAAKQSFGRRRRSCPPHFNRQAHAMTHKPPLERGRWPLGLGSLGPLNGCPRSTPGPPNPCANRNGVDLTLIIPTLASD